MELFFWAADKDWALCVMYHKVADTAHDGAAEFAHATCAHHDIGSVVLLGILHKKRSRLLKIRDKLSRNLKIKKEDYFKCHYLIYEKNKWQNYFTFQENSAVVSQT